jgi:hypothetical protein
MMNYYCYYYYYLYSINWINWNNWLYCRERDLFWVLESATTNNISKLGPSSPPRTSLSSLSSLKTVAGADRLAGAGPPGRASDRLVRAAGALERSAGRAEEQGIGGVVAEGAGEQKGATAFESPGPPLRQPTRQSHF